jgi:hypothetical protein
VSLRGWSSAFKHVVCHHAAARNAPDISCRYELRHDGFETSDSVRHAERPGMDVKAEKYPARFVS